MNAQFKSRERVKERGEVFTASREVNLMLDAIGDEPFRDLEARCLEPSCGNGAFLIEMLARKMKHVVKTATYRQDFEHKTIIALASIYGVDIAEDNVIEARERMRNLVVDMYTRHVNGLLLVTGFLDAVDAVLTDNIVVGDFLHGTETTIFSEYKRIGRYEIARARWRLSDILFQTSGPISAFPPVPYYALKSLSI